MMWWVLMSAIISGTVLIVKQLAAVKTVVFLHD